MPKALQVDWPLIQTLYSQGRSAKEISLDLGVPVGAIQTRASRHNWRRLAAKAREVVLAGQGEQGETDSASLTHRSNRVRNGLASVLERSIAKIEQMSVPTGKAAVKLSKELEPLVRNSKTVFGWQEGNSQPLVRIGIMASAVVVSAQEQGNEQASFNPGPTIDVSEG